MREPAKEAAAGVGVGGGGGKHSRFVENKTLIQTPSPSLSTSSSWLSSVANPKPTPSVLAVREQQQLRREHFAANWVSFATLLCGKGGREGGGKGICSLAEF